MLLDFFFNILETQEPNLVTAFKYRRNNINMITLNVLN